MRDFTSNWARRRTDTHLRLALLGGVSLIAWGIVVVRAPEAHAEQTPTSTASTVNSDGTGIYVAPNVNLTGSPGISNNTITDSIYSQGTIDSGSFGVINSSIVGTLTNAGGTIIGNSNGVYNTAGSIGTLSNSGLIDGSGGNARGVQNQGGTIGLLTNSGTITGTSGIAAQTGIGTIINEYGGTISSANGQDYGIYVNAHIDLIVNRAGATISGASGILVQSHDISTLTNVGLITGSYGIGNLNGTIGMLDNAGTIFGSLQGIYNNDQIGTLANALGGTISSLSTAIQNSGTIGTLTNNGTISGVYAIVNETAGTIGALSNATGGLISAASSGIDNYGLIQTLTNNGTITVGVSGIYNKGLINTLTNSGTISAEYGIVNGDYEGTIGTIGAIYNTGTVVGSEDGLDNAGTIGAVTNSGTIYGMNVVGIGSEGYIGTLANLFGGTIAGYEVGVGNSGTITNFTNAGLIESTATSGSTIAGIINIGAIDTLTNETGGVIASNSDGILNVGGTIGVGTIGVLTNAIGALITAGGTGIYNDGAIGALTNNGTILGDYGIGNGGSNTSTNHGTIDVLTNTGLISTYYTALYNYDHIGTLTNSGTIFSLNDTGIDNSGSIGLLTNSGTISGNYEGVGNGGTITDFTNSGLIESTATDEAIYNNGTIGALTNQAGGTISGYYEGVYNEGTIGLLTNAGLISGGSTGLYNYAFATIASLVNSGTIYGGDDGIYNEAFSYGFYSGNIGTLSNSGLISGGSDGIYNKGTIGTISNSGIISGGTTGIHNKNAISTIINSGTITGGYYDGIFNDGTIVSYTPFLARAQVFATTTSQIVGSIGGITNTGIISGVTGGIFNEGYIGSITNSGTIFGSVYGIYNGDISRGTITSSAIAASTTTSAQVPATIGQITNTGTISGITGIYLTGGGTTITNSGTITSTDGGNAIYFGGVNDLILTTGSVIDGTIAGGGTASQIALEGNGSLDNEIADFGPGSALSVTPGADWTATGNWTIASVINDGVFQPGRLGTPLTLTGDYLQNADGTMRVLVTPTTSTQFNITGAATLSGTVTYVLAPGHYSPHIYPYLTATDGVTGEFTTVNYGEIPKGLASTQYVEDPVVQLVLSGSFNIPNIINPDDSTIFSAQTQALAQEADADTGALLQKAALGGAATSPACAAEAPLSPNKTGASGTGANMASALASVFCGAGGWIEATGSLGHADPSGGAPAYDANTAGFLAGVDKVVSPTGTRVGFAVGYDETYLSDKLGGGGRMGTTRVALYAAQPAGMFTLAGVLEYGNANNTTSRVSGDGNLSESNSVSIWSGGLQLSTDITMHGIDFVPAAGLRVASVGGGSHFAEGASGIAAAFAVSGKTTQYNSVQPYVLVEGKQTFLTASGMTVTPDAEIGYEYEAGTHGIVTTLYGADGTVFYTPHNDLDPSDALLSAGISVSKNNWSLFATYTAHVAANWDTQVGEAGLRITF